MAVCKCKTCLSQERISLKNEENYIKDNLIIYLRKENEDLKNKVFYWENKYLDLFKEVN